MSTYVRELSQALSEKGYPVGIFTCRGLPGNEAQFSDHANLKYIHICPELADCSKEVLYEHCASIAGEIIDYTQKENLQFDVIYSQYWISGIIGEILKDKWGIPHIINFHTLGAIKNKLCVGENEPAFRLNAENNLMSKVDRIIVPSLYERENVVKLGECVAGKIKVIPAGVNRKLFRFMDQSQARVQLGFDQPGSTDMKILFALGRIEPVKGFDLLIEAFSTLAMENSYKLIIAGGSSADDPLIKKLKSLAVSRGARDSIVFPGKINHHQLPLYYNAADLTVITSYYESFALVALESVSCGTPLAATPVGVIPELMDGKNSSRLGCILQLPGPFNWADTIRDYLLQGWQIDAETADESLAPYNWPGIANSLADEIDQLRREGY